MTGAVVNQFLTQSALKEACAVIEREQSIRLSEPDWKWMLEVHDHPPEPNENLTAALERYRQANSDDADAAFINMALK